MGTAIKHPVPDRVKPSFVILTSGHSDAQGINHTLLDCWREGARDVTEGYTGRGGFSLVLPMYMVGV